MITVAGTVFSITIAALTLASSQFGLRLLRNFTRDTGNQVVLGTFVATFLYCLLVLRTVRSRNEGDFVPSLSVTVAVLLAIASIAVLIYYISHIAGSIQAENLVSAVGREVQSDVRRLSSGSSHDTATAALPGRPGRLLPADATGYILSMDYEGLVVAAEADDLFLHMRCRPGDFLAEGEPLLEVWNHSDGTTPEDAVLSRLSGKFSISTRRTPIQDVRYGFAQLSEIATRALSPGINDPNTAMSCVDWTVAALMLAARCGPRPGIRLGAKGEPRMMDHPVSFEELLEIGFGPVRTYGCGDPAVVRHALDALDRLGRQVECQSYRAAIGRTAGGFRAASRDQEVM